MTDLLIIGSHVEDLSDGRSAGPGEVVKDVDLNDPHNQRLINDGVAVEYDSKAAEKAAKEAKAAEKEEAERLAAEEAEKAKREGEQK